MAVSADQNKIRAKVFLKYLIHAAKKHNFKPITERTAKIYTKKELGERIIERSNFLDRRTMEISDEREKELETKIKIHYTQNKYLPFEERLMSLRKRLYALKRKKNSDKKKIKLILGKLKGCEQLLKKMKSNDLIETDI